MLSFSRGSESVGQVGVEFRAACEGNSPDRNFAVGDYVSCAVPMIHYLSASLDHALVAWNILHYAGHAPVSLLWHGTVAGGYVGGYQVGNTMYRMK